MNGTLVKPKIDFESEIVSRAHNLSGRQIQDEIDKRIVSVASKKFRGEKLRRLKTEAIYLAVSLLRKGQ